MAHCNFNIPFTAAPDELIGGVRSAIKKHKGTLDGDTGSGKFKIPVGIGDIEGHYTVEGSTINIGITKKPIIVTCKMIEHRLKGYIAAE